MGGATDTEDKTKLLGKKYPGILNFGLDLTGEDVPIEVSLEIQTLQINGTIPRHVKGAVVVVRVQDEPVRHGFSRYAIESVLKAGTEQQQYIADWLRDHVDKRVTIYLLPEPTRPLKPIL